MAFHTKQWGAPYAGGWLEWPAGLVDRMSTLLAYTNAFQQYHNNAGNPRWANANPGAFALVARVWSWRKQLGQEWW